MSIVGEYFRVGFVGIGRMGRWMASHLIANGYRVTVYDVNPESIKQLADEGAVVAENLNAVAADSDVIITMLPNSTIVESVLGGNDGLFQAAANGTYIVDMSSSFAGSTMKLAQEAMDRGIIFLDAPVSGGTKGAREATLTIMVGGDAAAFTKIHPLLASMGKKIIHVGKVGHGHALKAINNFLSAASMYATTEAMFMADSVGLDLETCLETINGSSGQSYSTHYKFPKFVLGQSFDSEFSLDLHLKDLKMAVNLARDNGIPVFLGGVLEQVYEAARQVLGTGRDHTEIVRYLEETSGRSLSSLQRER